MARHREALYYFAFRYLRNEAASRDVVQETFVRVYFKAAKYSPSSSVKTWIFAIALNQCRDHARRLKRHQGDVFLDALAPDETLKWEPADPGPQPSDTAARSDRFCLLQKAIDQLPHKLKSALILFSLEGRTQQDAAQILGTTPKTVELRVYHAKHKLRELLTDDLLDE